MNDSQKLQKLRAEMVKEGIKAFLVPRTDEYQGEYVAQNAERLKWLTGFSGSAGLAVITPDKAVVMSDGRYTLQLAQQVDPDLYSLVNSQDTKPEEWIKANVKADKVIGYDPKLHTRKQILDKEKAGLILKPCANLIDCIWKDQPEQPNAPAFLFDEKFAGKTAKEKITDLQNHLKKNHADGAILTLSDSIAWLLNVRGRDIPYIPIILSYAFLPAQGRLQWFVKPGKITKDVKSILAEIVDFHAETDIDIYLRNLSGQKILYDPKRSSVFFYTILNAGGAEVIEADDPCIIPRSCKNHAEQNAMKQAHIRDGVALVKFLHWFENKADTLDELGVEEKLESFRREASEFKEPSFSTIAGFGSNGAIVHYRATQKSNKKLESGNLLLLDSGAQYEDGTTDITRTIAVGDPTPEMKERNTLVLKGHIALAGAKFKEDTTGKELDVLARKPLHEAKLDFSHGTGHGVGCYLSVHEEAAKGISPRADASLRAGMILSNEPGYYKEGEYGIRIENLILTKEADEGSLYFETISFCPLDKNLIMADMLTKEEIDWVNDYHAQVFDKLSPFLDVPLVAWLKEKTAEISGGL